MLGLFLHLAYFSTSVEDRLNRPDGPTVILTRMLMINTMKDIIRRGKYYLIGAALIVGTYTYAELRGYRLLDVLGSDRWEQSEKSTNSHYHK